jgi:hypothetical protein
MTFLIYGGVVVLVILTGVLLALVFALLGTAVTNTKTTLEREEKSYNPAVTLGHKIKVQADYEEQLEQARLAAAKKAAALPRGANLRIGRLGQSTLKTASEGLELDPQSTVRIARFHGWDGARLGIPADGGAPAPVAAAGAPTAIAAPAAAQEIELVPGRDYPVIEITDAMSPEDVRKARIANSKAKSAAMKAAKAAQGAVGAPVAVPAGQPVAAGVAAPAAMRAPVATGIQPPKMIEITDDMAPEDVRKARIENAKARSAYNKALKAAGIDPSSVGEGEVAISPAAAAPAAAAPTPVAAPTPAAARPAAAAGIPEPSYIEITDAMSPDEIRQARIQNSKLRSAYNKSLKAAGIDPASLESSGEPAVVAQPAVAQPAETVAAASTANQVDVVPAAPTAAAAAASPVAGIPRPEYIEITDDMSPQEIRQARIENSKLRSAYNKALKAAGIDPSTVE